MFGLHCKKNLCQSTSTLYYGNIGEVLNDFCHTLICEKKSYFCVHIHLKSYYLFKRCWWFVINMYTQRSHTYFISLSSSDVISNFDVSPMRKQTVYETIISYSFQFGFIFLSSLIASNVVLNKQTQTRETHHIPHEIFFVKYN